jgi:hypothetical protein
MDGDTASTILAPLEVGAPTEQHLQFTEQLIWATEEFQT